MSRDKQSAKSDGFCSTDEMMSQINLGDQNELEQQGNNPAQPPVVPFVPPEGMEYIALPPEMQDFLPPPSEELENQVLLDIPQPPAQPSEVPQQPAQPPEVPQPADQVRVFPQATAQMPMTWNSSHYNPLSAGFCRNNNHYNPAGIRWNHNHHNLFSKGLNPQPSVAQLPVLLRPAAQVLEYRQPVQPNQVDGNAPSGNNDGNNDERMIPYSKEKRKERVQNYLWNKKPRLNFNKKIRYNGRQTQADNRLRKKGRFVKNSEAEPSHRCGLGASDPDARQNNELNPLEQDNPVTRAFKWLVDNNPTYYGRPHHQRPHQPQLQQFMMQQQQAGEQQGRMLKQQAVRAQFTNMQQEQVPQYLTRRLEQQAIQPHIMNKEWPIRMQFQVPQVPVQFQPDVAIPPQDASLQSQELARQNNELRSQVHRQGHEELIPLSSWTNAPLGSVEDHEAATLEQELDTAGLWKSDAEGGDDQVSGQEP